MAETYHSLYIKALTDGLDDWNKTFRLSDGEETLLQEAKRICGQKEQLKFSPLSSILGKVWGENIDQFFQPVALEFRNMEPAEISAIGTEDTPPSPEDIKKHLDKMMVELKELIRHFSGSESDYAFRYSLFHLMYKWGSRIGYSAEKNPDLSWFDRNRVLAATAGCLAHSDSENEKPFLLVKGAVSGIQRYIYHEIGGEQIGDAVRASKRLRGRSFLVAWLGNMLAEHIVQTLEIDISHIIFVGGGHFNLLLPNNQNIKENLNKLRDQVNRGLLDKMGPQLNLVLAFEECSENLITDIGDHFTSINDRLEGEKYRRHKNYLKEVFLGKGMNFVKKDDQEETQAEKLGKFIPYADFILELEGSADSLNSFEEASPRLNRDDTLSFLGKHYYFFSEKKDENVFTLLGIHSKTIADLKLKAKVFALNRCDFLPEGTPFSFPVAFGFQFSGNFAPVNAKGNILLFEELAKLDEKGEEKLSYPQLAAMRLDVDDLGTLFAYGLGNNRSFPRMACLSREFNLFFSGYFNRLAEDHHLYITYSGGDDAFVIGSWLNVLLFSNFLNRDFRKFTCGNPHVSLSAGIFTCAPTYPVVRFADESKDQLEQEAKKYREKDPLGGKNAIRVFNHTMYWHEFAKMMEFGQSLLSVVPKDNLEAEQRKGDVILRSMLQRLLDIIQTSRGDDFEFYRQVGRLHALISRHGYTQQKLEETTGRKQSSSLIQEILQKTGNREAFEHLLVPFHYVLYQTRTINS